MPRARAPRARHRGALAAVVFVLGLLVALVAPATAAPRPDVAGFDAARAVPAVGVPAAGVPAVDMATAFKADYVLGRDGSATVTQHITWQFPEGEERHGITRNIKVRAGYQDREDTYRYYDLSDVSVTSPTGAPTDLQINDFGAYKRLRIGSPTETVRGSQQYVIKFRLANIVNGLSDHAEFYYNVIDASNSDDYAGVQVSVRAEEAADRAKCFYGPTESTTECTATAGNPATFTPTDAQASSGFSVLASFPLTAFDTLEPDLRDSGSASDDSYSGGSTMDPEQARRLGLLATGAGVLLPSLAAALMGLLVWSRGRDEQYAGLTPGLTPGAGETAPVVRGRKQPVVVQFAPPEGVAPGLVGTVIDEEANTVDVSATVVDLAARGYLTMEETQSGMFGRPDWHLTRTQPREAGPPLADYEALLLDGLFRGGSSVLLSDLRNTFSGTLRQVQSHMYAEVVRRGWFRSSPQAQRAAWQGLGGLMMFGAVAVPFLMTFTGMGFALGLGPLVTLAAGIFVTGLILTVLGRRMASKTADGSAVLAQSLGFKRYLETAEANQIRFEEAQQIFSRYLPYAIVFGVAERWARVFKEVSEAAAAQGVVIGTPIWYIGPGMGDFEHMTSGLDDFATTAAGTFTSTPGSSGGSGFDMGGGFSGGGGGGESGGSW
ncbi:MAG: DUF2207 domain-containing protein [Micrococcales bacterium]|nr:DUF2207 domain-containing protein [Micrococcales bacterium]